MGNVDSNDNLKEVAETSPSFFRNTHVAVANPLLNSLLSGCPNKSLQSLQLIQNAAARVLTILGIQNHITPVLASLHWLPVKYRTEFKILLLTYHLMVRLHPVLKNLQCLMIRLEHWGLSKQTYWWSQNSSKVEWKPELSVIKLLSCGTIFQSQFWGADTISTLKSRLQTFLFDEAYS